VDQPQRQIQTPPSTTDLNIHPDPSDHHSYSLKTFPISFGVVLEEIRHFKKVFSKSKKHPTDIGFVCNKGSQTTPFVNYTVFAQTTPFWKKSLLKGKTNTKHTQIISSDSLCIV
jgi:hypothetical protein